MKKIIAIIFCLFILGGVKVKAEDTYHDNYSTYLGDTFDSIIDSDTKDILEKDGLSPDKSDWVTNLKAQNIFKFVLSLLKGDIKKPIFSFFSICGIILLFSAFNSFGNEKYLRYIEILSPAVIISVVGASVYACSTAAAESIRASSAFMIGLIPALTSLLAASGKTATAATSSVTMLLSANAVSSFATYGVLPLMGGYLSVSIAAGVSPLVANINPAETLKKVTYWVLTFISTVFLGVLTLQNAVMSSSDDVALKTAKFVLGTSVPVAGGVLSEAVSAVSSSVSMLKNSVAIYAVIVVALLILPVLVDVILWRCCFSLSAVVGELFGQKKTAVLLRSVDSVLAAMLGIMLLSGALFIISLASVVAVGKGV
ncbi:MAG: hypothetical protein IJJ40_06170 [Clostridia bacterium]|nr:hypothetical protein [Clostridia bacterium]